MKSFSARILLLAALALLGLVVAGCGHKQKVTTEADTEGIYVDVDHLNYQVQISRQLNPHDPEDQAYLEGIPVAKRKLPADEAWFAVFIRVQNLTTKPQPMTRRYRIVDTQDTEYKPVSLPAANQFSYQPPAELAKEAVYPDPDSPSGDGVVQGSLLLFKVKLTSLANRPLEFKISSPLPPAVSKSEATVKLDV